MFSTTLRRVPIRLCRNEVTTIFCMRSFEVDSSKNLNQNILISDVKVRVPNFCGIHEYVFSKYEKFGNHMAYECGATGRKYTFLEMRQYSRNFSKNLRKKLKLNRGDVVAIMLENIPEFPIAILGIYEAGLILTTVNPIFTSYEISKQLQSSSAKCILTLPSLYQKVKKAIEESNRDITVICIKTRQADSLPQNTIDFFEFSKTNIDIPDIRSPNPSDVCTILYSSGTTGMPKGVEVTHGGLIHEQCVLDAPGAMDLRFPTASHQDVIPLVLPMFHAFGLVVSILCMSTHGVKAVTVPKFSPDNLISVLKNHKISVMATVPPLVLFLNNYEHMKQDYLKYLRYVLCGAASLPSADEDAFLNKYGTQELFLATLYGSTEGGSTTITKKVDSMDPKFEKSKGSVGTVHANVQIKIVPPDNPSDVSSGPGESGEIFVKSGHVMKGYLNNPEATKEALQDGWFRTGDVGYFNENGEVFVCDRIKDLIKVKGFQVAPAELEEILRNHPGVKEAAVIGVPHKRYGEVPRAYVVPKCGESLCPIKLNDYFKDKVAKYKQLAGGIEIIEDIPKNATGKMLKKNLKVQYAASRER